MSNLFSYDVSYSPDPATATVTVDVKDGTKLNATISDVPSFDFSLTPTGNFVQKILSAILTPIADLIAHDNRDKPADMLNGKSDIIMTAQSFPLEGVTITPSHLALGSFQEGSSTMLKVTGELTLSAS